MVEYGNTVGQGSGAAGGVGAGSFDAGPSVFESLSDVLDRIAAQPPEVLLLVAAVIVGGLFLFRRAA